MTSSTALSEISAEAYFDAYLKFECSPHALKKMVDDGTAVQIIDMRNPASYAKGHVPGAVNVELKDIESHSAGMSKELPVVVYCYDSYCHVAARGALRLARKGFQVQKLLGGYDVLMDKYPDFRASAKISCSTTDSSNCG